MTCYYSQHGEDFLLSEMLKHETNGFFVEVGCIDGRRFSNTLTFEERGWKGLCVEAHSAYISLLMENRPRSIICHCAAGEKDEDAVTFYANARGSLSTLDKSMEDHFKERYGGYFTGFEEQRIKKQTLNTLLYSHSIRHIDILSVDVEGYEAEVLKGVDFEQFRPRIMVIESENADQEQRVDQIVIPAGYVKSFKLGSNRFYLSDISLAKNIRRKLYRVSLIHTTHPLDSGPDHETMVEIDMREQDQRFASPAGGCEMTARLGRVFKEIKTRFWGWF